MQIKETIVFENLLNTYITRGLRVTLVTLLRLVFRKNYYMCANLNSPKTEQVLLLACEQEQSYTSTSQALCTHYLLR